MLADPCVLLASRAVKYELRQRARDLALREMELVHAIDKNNPQETCLSPSIWIFAGDAKIS